MHKPLNAPVKIKSSPVMISEKITMDDLENTGRSIISQKRFVGVFVFLLLCLTVLISLGSSIHSQLLTVGEALWDNYYVLDPDASSPSCNTQINIEDEINKQILSNSNELDLFEAEPISRDDIRHSIENNLVLCGEKHKLFNQIQTQLTPLLINYKSIETGLADWLLSNLDSKKFLLIIILFICAIAATLKNEHIALTSVEKPTQELVSAFFQLFANSAISYSFWIYHDTLAATENSSFLLQEYWLIGFMSLSIVNAYTLFKLSRANLTIPRLKDLLSVPLYVYMCIIAFAYFNLHNNHPSGLAIYINQLTNLSNIFLNIGLYVFIGMILKHTQIPVLCFNVLRPWQLAPPLLASIIIFATAYPTAFTGASGIFILAVGGLIYEELRKSGASRPLSLATTAMSGSMGVILNPCLLIVIIAALNKEVTTDGLYDWGFIVFLMSASIFSSFVLFKNKGPLIGTKSIPDSFKAMLHASTKLVPYITLGLIVVVGFNLILGVQFNEYSAPLILPIVLTVILAYERLWLNKTKRIHSFVTLTADSAGESSVHIGALLMLIALSICLGGVLERSEAIEFIFPASLSSPWIAMLISLILLTIIGMFMDPFGAVILVSATFSHIVIQAGVHPLHFWMVALVAFELGYLSPPVALNHLLTRLVVGNNELQESIEDTASGSFYQRNERILLPIIVMMITLLITAFVPLALYS